LREHQLDAVQQIEDSYERGSRKILLAAPCSFGKTHLAAYLLKKRQDAGDKCVFFVDRLKLVAQTEQILKDWGVDYGVVQGNHPLTDARKPVQIVSVDTMRRREQFDYDFGIVDECHIMHKTMREQMNTHRKDANFVGLSATPYSEGLGDIFDDLVVPLSQKALIEKGFLCRIRYFGGSMRIDTSGVLKKKLPTGILDYHDGSLAKYIEENHQERYRPLSYTIHHAPYTIHYTLYTHAPCTMHHTLMHHTPYTTHHTPYTVHQTRYNHTLSTHTLSTHTLHTCAFAL
jgi:superfamily II DNA or RNA helicase